MYPNYWWIRNIRRSDREIDLPAADGRNGILQIPMSNHCFIGIATAEQ